MFSSLNSVKSFFAVVMVSFGALFLYSCAGKLVPVPAPQVDNADTQIKMENAMTGEGFAVFCELNKKKALEAVATLKTAKDPSATEVLGLMNSVEMSMDDAYNRAGLFQYTHPDKIVREAAAKCEQDIVQLDTALKLDRDLYLVFAGLEDSKDKLDGTDTRYLEKILREFRRNGVDKSEDVRNKIAELKKSMTELEQTFDRNLAADTRFVELKDAARLAGLPQDFIDSHKPDENGVIKVSTNWPDYYPVMQYAKDAQLRHDMWMNMMGLGFPKNTQVFVDVLKVRSEFAKLLGYASWADYATEEMMIKSPANSGEFIDKLADLARPIAERDKQELLEFKKTLVPAATAIDPWEKHYIKRLAKAAKYDYSQEEVRRYFEIDKVRQGILETSSRLYGIEFKPVEGETFWHESVQVFDVFEKGERIGRIHLDLFPRENKYKSFAMFPMVGGVDGIRISQGAIVGNFPDPSKSQGPALVDHYDVVTFFHEFGHLMHHILSGKQRYMRFSGTATEWDFVEVPSQLYEEWAWDHDVLKTFATDSEGKAIPEELVAKLQDSDNFAKGLQVQQQMYYAALSRGLYVTDPEGIDIEKFNKEICAKYSPWPYVEGTHFIEGFSHLIGYSSNYYTYMWSLVIEKDMVSPFKAKGMMDLETSTAYRKYVLGAGGSNDAAELVKVFLGREFQFEAFKSWLEKK